MSEEGDARDQRLFTYVFFERQVDLLCAVHSINNALQGPRFAREVFDQFACQLECDSKESKILHHDQMGNYSDDTIKMALESIEAVMIPVSKEFLDIKRATEGFSLQCQTTAILVHSRRRHHWWTLRYTPSGWYVLDSVCPGPEAIEDDILSFLSNQMCEDITFYLTHSDQNFRLPRLDGGLSSAAPGLAESYHVG